MRAFFRFLREIVRAFLEAALFIGLCLANSNLAEFTVA
jgi:hypothetical protein